MENTANVNAEKISKSTDYLGKMVEVVIDRPLASKHPKHGFIYELNYGYIANTVSGDGEELDAYVLGEHKPLEKFTGRVIAIVHRTEEDDDKLIVTKDGRDYSNEQIEVLVEFQEQWKKYVIVR